MDRIRITVTHPCHPFSGREVELIQGPATRSDRTVLVQLPKRGPRRLPKAWTSLAAPDPYALLSPPPLLKPESLLELAEWIRSRKTERPRGEQPEPSDVTHLK